MVHPTLVPDDARNGQPRPTGVIVPGVTGRPSRTTFRAGRRGVAGPAPATSSLVVNAHRHGRTPVRVTVGDRTVVVRDHGPGFPEDLLRDGPRRFRTGAAERGSGHGLGLTIAVGQAGLLGAGLRFANAPDGGAVATLSLPG